MQYGVEHPVCPLHAPARQLPNPLEDGIAVAVLFGQDRQDDWRRGSGYQVLVDLHDFPRRAALTNSNPSVHSNTIHGSVMYIKRSEEHTSELQSRQYLVCRLLLEKKIVVFRGSANASRKAVS